MPNVEIHGCDPVVSQMFKKQIFEELFAGKPYVEEMVVKIAPGEVTDKKGNPRPFFRLLSSDSGEAEEILQILEENLPGIDIEYVEIAKFIPKKQPQKG